MKGEIDIQSLEKKFHPEAARNREAVQAFLQHPDRFVTPVVRQKLTEDDRIDIRIAKANFKKLHGAAWEHEHAKKKAQRKAVAQRNAQAKAAQRKAALAKA